MRFVEVLGVILSGWPVYGSPIFLLEDLFFCVRMLQNRVATDDNLRRCGMVLPSFCCMCRCSDETVDISFLVALLLENLEMVI